MPQINYYFDASFRVIQMGFSLTSIVIIVEQFECFFILGLYIKTGIFSRGNLLYG